MGGGARNSRGVVMWRHQVAGKTGLLAWRRC